MDEVLAVTGVTGHSGQFFLKELEEHNYPGIVRCLVRETSNTELLDKSPLRIEKMIGDNRDYQILSKLTKNAATVMHISKIHQSENVLKACIENSVKRIVMVHTTGVYSKFKAASEEYKEIEGKIDGLLKQSDIDATILNPTMIFGDMRDHNISKFIKMVDKYPVMPEINHGSGKIRPVNARDLAKAYYSACVSERLPKIRYDLSGERSLSLHELFDLIGQYLGKRVYHINCSMWVASTGARIVKGISFGKVDFVEKVLRMGENRDYSHDAATRDLGYSPEPFDIGLKREVEEYIDMRK